MSQNPAKLQVAVGGGQGILKFKFCQGISGQITKTLSIIPKPELKKMGTLPLLNLNHRLDHLGETEVDIICPWYISSHWNDP